MNAMFRAEAASPKKQGNSTLEAPSSLITESPRHLSFNLLFTNRGRGHERNELWRLHGVKALV